jgi:hypothetical protein
MNKRRGFSMDKIKNSFQQRYQHMTRLLVILIMIFILLTIGTLPATASDYDGLGDYVEVPHSSIQYHLESLSEQDTTQPNPIPTGSTWIPYAHQKDSGKGFIWLRLSISQLQNVQQIHQSLERDGLHDERLQLFLYPSPFYYEVYQNNQLIHQFGDLNDTDPREKVPRWDTLPLDNPSDDVYIHLRGKIPYLYTLGSEAQLVE